MRWIVCSAMLVGASICFGNALTRAPTDGTLLSGSDMASTYGSDACSDCYDTAPAANQPCRPDVVDGCLGCQNNGDTTGGVVATQGACNATGRNYTGAMVYSCLSDPEIDDGDCAVYAVNCSYFYNNCAPLPTYLSHYCQANSSGGQVNAKNGKCNFNPMGSSCVECEPPPGVRVYATTPDEECE